MNRTLLSRKPTLRVLALGLAVILNLTGCGHGNPDGLRTYLDQMESRRLERLRSSLADHELTDEGAAVEKTSSNWLRRVALASYQEEPETQFPDETEEQASRPSCSRNILGSRRETFIRDARAFPADVWDQTVEAYTDPLNVVVLLGATGTAISLKQHADDVNADHFRDENNFGKPWRDTLSAVGHPGTHFALAGLWYAAGLATGDEQTYDVGKTLIDALTINGLSTLLLKVATDRESPNGEEWAFPSGHTSSTVAFATVMNEAYGPLVGIPLYGVSTLVAMERLDDREHWMSDVIFGAALGWTIGRSVAKGRRPEILGGEIIPYVDPDNQISGIAWMKTF